MVLLAGWLGWQLLLQNGRILLRLDELEQRQDEIEFGEGDEHAGVPSGSDTMASGRLDSSGQARTQVLPRDKAERDGGNGINEENGRAGRFGRRSLVRSRIKR